jgi:hypothetical protein
MHVIFQCDFPHTFWAATSVDVSGGRRTKIHGGPKNHMINQKQRNVKTSVALNSSFISIHDKNSKKKINKQKK